MAFSILTPTAALLARSGVRYLLTDGSIPTPLTAPARTFTSLGTRPVQQQRTPPAPSAGYRQPRPQQAPRPVRQAQPAPRQPLQEAAQSQIRQKSCPTLSSDISLLPREQWPALWQQRFAKTKPGRIVWTYWELGLDISGHPDAARRECLTNLIKDLHRPAGTHTFWPIALPDAELKLQADSNVFWSGLHEMGTRILVIMGSRAARAAGIQGPLLPLQFLRLNGLFIWVTWDFARLFESPKRYDETRLFLHSSMRACNL